MTRPPAGPLLGLAALALAAVALAPDARADEAATVVTARSSTAGTLGLADARSWLGRSDGGAIEAGVRSRFALQLLHERHALTVEATAAAAIAPSPHGDDLVKGTDGLAADVRWVRYVMSWFGPYVRAGAGASLFRATDDRDADTAFRVERAAGRVETIVAERLVLTEPLRPVTLHQEAGAAIHPVRTAPVDVVLLAGVGGRQTLAEGQLALDDDPATATVEVLEARDAAHFGVVGGVAIDGALDAIALDVRLRLDTSFPVVHTEPPAGSAGAASGEAGPMDLASLEASGQLAFALGSFASIGYEFAAVREPLVLDAIQFKSSLCLTLGVSLGERPSPRR
jgi:hypothetical protein